MKKQTKMIYLSPTGLQEWLKCPARLWWAQDWERRKQEDNFGSNVHRRMEDGSEYDAAADFEQVKAILPKMRQMERDLGYVVLAREAELRCPLPEAGDDVVLTRRFDAVARLHDKALVFVDYKSCSKPWATVVTPEGVVAPKARTLQGAGYLLPIPHRVSFTADPLRQCKVLSDYNWPRKMLFLMGPAEGGPNWWVYERDAEDEAAFLDVARWAAESIRTARATGRVNRAGRGEECDNRRVGYRGQVYGWACPWLEVCYDRPGWKKSFKRKVREHESST